MSDSDQDELTNDPTTPEARLVDIVVEEVSLVDQAANKRQFLVIKRARSGMSETNVTKGASDTSEAATLEAVERVGKAVAELADEIDEPGEVARLVAIAEQLGELVRSILEADEEEDEEEQEEADEEEEEEQTKINDAAAPPPTQASTPAPNAPPLVAAPASSPNAGAFAKIEEMLAALRTKVTAPSTPSAPAAPSPPAPAPPSPAQTASVVDPLAKVLDAIHALGTDLKAHGQRLGRLEKGVGLPSSQQTNERTRREPAEISWPLDLNAPVGRDSVDKRISFHDD